MKAKPLTPKERAWLKKLEAVMQECPSKRLACYTIGDNDLVFFDVKVRDSWQNENRFIQTDAPLEVEQSESFLKKVVANFYIESRAG